MLLLLTSCVKEGIVYVENRQSLEENFPMITINESLMNQVYLVESEVHFNDSTLYHFPENWTPFAQGKELENHHYYTRNIHCKRRYDGCWSGVKTSILESADYYWLYRFSSAGPMYFGPFEK